LDYKTIKVKLNKTNLYLKFQISKKMEKSYVIAQRFRS